MVQYFMELLNVKELSKMLGVNAKTLYQWASLRQIPHIRMSRSIRFDLNEVLAWLESCKMPPKEGYNIGTQARGPWKGGG